jgi:GNAT superfamily N-acetyltransferase
VNVRHFVAADQHAVRELIVAGLVEHWGESDDTLNPDLVDIATSYRDDIFVVAVAGDHIVACGACRVRGAVGEIVRMSVHNKSRRRGIATVVLDALVDAARPRGVNELVLETQATWEGARAFYESYGFAFTHIAEGAFGPDAWYRLELSPTEDG